MTSSAIRTGCTPATVGAAGTQNKLWEIAEVSDTSVTLELGLPDGEGGFPGNRAVAARFSLLAGGVLELRVAMTTDRDTIVNFANHSFWNLDGTDTYAGHQLQVAADRRCLADDRRWSPAKWSMSTEASLIFAPHGRCRRAKTR